MNVQVAVQLVDSLVDAGDADAGGEEGVAVIAERGRQTAPSSAISTDNRSPSRRTVTRAVALPEWRCTLVRLSCTIRKTAVSRSRGSRPRSSGASTVVAMPLRC